MCTTAEFVQTKICAFARIQKKFSAWDNPNQGHQQNMEKTHSSCVIVLQHVPLLPAIFQFRTTNYWCKSHDSAVGIMTRLQAGRSRIQILAAARNFIFPNTSRSALMPTQPPLQQVPVFFPEGKETTAWSWQLTSI